MIGEWKEVGECVREMYEGCVKGVDVIKKKVDLEGGSMVFDLLMRRDY